MLTDRQQIRYRDRLLERKEELLKELQDRKDLTVERAADPLDDAIGQSNRMTTAAELHQKAELLRRIKQALDRLIHGDFGVCLECDEDIPEVRLNAVPWAERCIHCQHQLEREG